VNCIMRGFIINSVQKRYVGRDIKRKGKRWTGSVYTGDER